MKDHRRNLYINTNTSIYWNIDEGEIHLFTDSGRVIRPLFVLEEGKLLYTENIREKIKNNKLSWCDLLNKTKDSFCIEYIDPSETNNCFISPNVGSIVKNKYTHSEIHPSLILGALASCIPFPIIINHPEIHINLRWVSKQLEFIAQITIIGLIHLAIYCLVLKNLL